MSNYLKFILVVFACWSLNSVAIGQETLADKKERADEFFKNRNWIEAEALYGSIITDDPKNHDLNFRYGTCLLNGSKNKEEAIRRLRYAVTGPSIDNRAYYYLGRAYHLNYQFNEAIKQYAKFQQVATPQDLKELDVETDLKACNFGKKLLANITSMIVIQKTELKAERFYDLYKLDDIGGSLNVTDRFQTKLDKKMNHRPIIHFPKNSPYIYYSSYGEDGSTGLDIYVKKQLPGGEWSLAQKVQGSVNTDKDEDFPYMNPSGEYLYYSSKGHNSMGGYDVFRSKFNPNTNSFDPPENMDFAISSPDDDILFVVDSLDRLAYFASSRESSQGNMIVYKVRVDRIPMQMAVIKGNFLNTISADQKEITIEVEDFSSGRVIGTFNSKQTNGDYLMTFPKGGKYKLVITAKGSEYTHDYVVDVPVLSEFKPLKQSMTLEVDANGEEALRVTDLFNESFEDPVGVLAEVYRELSKLNPNVQDFNIDSLDAIKQTDDVLVKAGLDVFVTQEGLQAIVEGEIAELEAAKELDQKQANIAFNLAAAKSELANAKMVELNKKLVEAEGILNPTEKTKALEQIIKDKKEIEQLNSEAQSLIGLGESIDKSVKEKEAEIAKATVVLNQVKAVKPGDRNALLSTVEQNTTYFEEHVKSKTVVENSVTEALREGNKEQKDVQKLSGEISELNKAKRDLEADNARINKQIEAEKKSSVKEELQRQIDKNDSEIAAIEQSISQKTKSLDKKLSENENVLNGMAAALVLKEENENLSTSLNDSDKNAIKDQVKTNNLTESLASVDRVLEENKVSIYNIDLYANSETTSQYSILDWKREIDAEQERLKLLKLESSPERQIQLQNEIDRLDKLREEKIAEFDATAETPKDIDPIVDKNELVPNLQKRIDQIDEIVNEEDRREARIELNNEILIALDKEKAKLESILQENPKDKNAKARLNNVAELQNQLYQENKKDEEWIAENNSKSTITQEQIISNLDPNYSAKINEAYQNPNVDERNEAIKGINGVVLEKANERIQELNAIIESDPTNEKAKNELKGITEFASTLNENIDQPLVEPVKVDVASISPTVKTNELVTDYDNRMAEVSAISDEQKRIEAENILYGEVIDKARTELANLDQLAQENPGNKNIEKRQDALKSLDKEYNKLLDKNKDWLAKNGTEIVPDKVETLATNPNLSDVYPDFDKAQSEINSSDRSDEEKNQANIALNEDLVSRIDEEIKNTESFKTQYPDQIEKMDERIQVLNDLKNSTETTIEELKTKAEPQIVQDERPKITIESLMPAYNVDLATIRNSNKPEIERLEEENALHKLLIGSIEWKIKSLEEEREEEPTLSSVINQEIADLEKIKSEKEALIKMNDAKIAAGPVVEEVRPVISIGSVMPDYDSQLTDIKNGAGSDADKWKLENELHQKLIEKTQSRIVELENEKDQNPSLASTIDVEIETLNNIRRKTESNIHINEDLISQSGEDNLDRTKITVGTLMSDFKIRMTEIDQSKASESEKLIQKNILNEELVNAIDTEIEKIQEEWEEDPNNGFTYDQEINKLEDFKSSVRSDMARNREKITAIEDDKSDVSSLTPTNYTTKNGQETIAEFNPELTEIKEIKAEISILEDQLNTSNDDKEKAKIQKNIDKLEASQAGLENEVIEGLQEANRSEITAGKNELEIDQKLSVNQNSELDLDEELRMANQNLKLADQKMNQAETLRNEAAKEKDVLVKNEKLSEAFKLEEEAKTLIEQSKRIYKAAVRGNEMVSDKEVIISVPENLDDRKSTQVLDQAADLFSEANNYYDRANFLRDSSESVKEKNRAPILAEAEKFQAKGDILTKQANELEAKGEDLQAQEAEILAVQISKTDKVVDAKSADEISTSESYKNYIEAKDLADKNANEIQTIQTEIEALKEVRTRKFKQAISGNAPNPENVLDNDKQLISNQIKIDSLTNLQNKLKDEFLVNTQKANNILNQQEADTKDDMMALEQEGVKPIVRKLNVNVDFEVPDVLDEDIFRTTTDAVYSEQSRIPVSDKQPSGLVYKVQVGAFRNPLPQDHFKEFAPISGEKLNNGITRFMVGYFKTFEPANSAKGKVNDLGYKDAFVVAYCNGNRITTDRARLIEQGLISCESSDNTDAVANTNTNNNNTNTNNNANNNANNTTANNNNNNQANNNINTNNNAGNNTYKDQSESLNIVATTVEEKALTAYYNSTPNAAKANQVEIIKGLFYTVQIGVYSKPVPNSALFNIQPLNSQRTETGFIRYSTGIFTSIEDATVRKNEVVQLGVTDAFVTAYFNGERITVEQALEVLKREGAPALVGRSEGEIDSGAGDNVPPPFKEVFYKEGLYYRILLGAYDAAIPGEYATLLLRGDDLIETEVNLEGQTVVLSSKLKTYEEMVDRLTEFADLGIEDMQIVTYYKYDVIPFDEGEKIRNGEQIDQLNPMDDLEGISANSYIYNKEAVYFKIKLGEFNDKVPSEFTNLLLLHEEEEGINKEETINDEVVFYTGSIMTYEEAEARKKELMAKGFNRAIIIAYHKYDEISVSKAREILGQ